MPTDRENTQFLYLFLTHDGGTTINWDEVGAALNLNKGAVTKRWSRLKAAMEKGETPSASTYQFLWLCVKHSQRTCAPNWIEIAQKCNTTPAAASKRYSRMKIAFEKDDNAAPGSPAAQPKASRKRGAKESESVEASPGAKRKRVAAKPAASAAESSAELDNEDVSDGKAKRVKASPRAKGKAVVKHEDEDGGADTFFDAAEVLGITTDAVDGVLEEHIAFV